MRSILLDKQFDVLALAVQPPGKLQTGLLGIDPIVVLADQPVVLHHPPSTLKPQHRDRDLSHRRLHQLGRLT